MKVGKITKATKKGQVVIPKEFRDTLKMGEGTLLHISMRGGGVYIHPIKHDLALTEEDDSAYLSVLEKTKGAWAATAQEDKRREQERRQLELQRSRKNKKQW